MSDLDVSLKLRLENQLSREAERAERDLKQLRKTADGLNRRNGNGLDRELGDVARKARDAGRALELPADKIKALNRLSTDKAEAELKQLRKAAKAAGEGVDKLRGQFDQLNNHVKRSADGIREFQSRMRRNSEIQRPAERLNQTMGWLATSTGNAFTGLLAFASVDNILRGLSQLEEGFNKVEAAAAAVAATAEMRTPEAVASITASNSGLGLKYGLPTEQVNNARNVFAAANFDLPRQEAILDPTVKAASAAGSSPETMARAVTAGMNNLGIGEKDVPAFLDQLLKGGKEGEFEIGAMARYFPELGALYRASGRTGLNASAELIALAQTVRKGTGNEDEAATNLKNLLSKITSPDTVKNFQEKGVRLERLAASANKSGTPYIIALLDEVERLTGGDAFKIGELFGDMQAKSALRPLLENRDFYRDTLTAVRDGSRGAVDRDEEFIGDTSQARADRRAAAWAATGRTVGGVWSSVVSPFRDNILGLINPAWSRSEGARAERKRLRNLDLEALEADIAETQDRISARPKMRFDLPDLEKQNLELRLQQLQVQLERARKAQGVSGPVSGADEATGAGGIPVPAPKPKLEKLSGQLGDAGQMAGQRFASALGLEAAKAGAIADELKARFSFNATPTITPSYSAAQPSKHAGGGGGGTGATTINQRIHGSSDPTRTARAVTREQNRAIRMARARALHDTGSYA
jgi:TP901 family phage tail tape measure protein